MKKQKSYKFRLYPNLEQRILFEKTFGCSRFIWNQMLADRKAHYEKTGESLKSNTPAQYKKEFPWLKEVDSLALANVQLKVHRQPKGVIKSATVSKTATGKYYISILCEEEILPLPKTNSHLGIDLGLENFAILSTGEKVKNPRFLISLSQKLVREQKVLSRRAHLAKKKGKKLSDCRNYQKQKLKVARIHERISNQRRDFLNQLSTNLIKNHDVICMEDLASKNLMKNHHLARAIGDASWSEFVRQLSYKADWYGKKIIQISRWFPSSQLCSSCGFSSGKKPLSIREWTCESCGVHHDRDINASLNILKEGLKQLV